MGIILSALRHLATNSICHYIVGMRTPNINCILCGEKVYRRPFQIKANNGKVYCSQKCFSESCKKPKKCMVCSKEVLSKLNRKTCSKECSLIWDKSPNRKHYLGRKVGSTNNLGNRSYRERFYSERGYKCECCGYDKTKILHIHHIIEKSKGGSDNPDNLLILCPNCHTNLHKEFLKIETNEKISFVWM
jgi:hypothetical protein